MWIIHHTKVAVCGLFCIMNATRKKVPTGGGVKDVDNTPHPSNFSRGVVHHECNRKESARRGR